MGILTPLAYILKFRFWHFCAKPELILMYWKNYITNQAWLGMVCNGTHATQHATKIHFRCNIIKQFEDQYWAPLLHHFLLLMLIVTLKPLSLFNSINCHWDLNQKRCYEKLLIFLISVQNFKENEPQKKIGFMKVDVWCKFWRQLSE